MTALDLEYKKTFSRYTALMKFIGIDFTNLGNLDCSKWRLCVYNIIFVPFICGQLSLVTRITADNFLEEALCIPVSVMLILGVIKMATALVKSAEVKRMLQEIGELWPKNLRQSEEKSNIMRSWLRRMGFLLNAFFVYAVVNLALFQVTPLLITIYNMHAGVGEYVFPFQLLDLWTVNSTATYLASYVWELASTVPCQLCLYLPFDMLIVTITSNVALLLRLLQVDLTNSIESQRDHGSFTRIVGIVKDHQKLLRIADQLSSIFGLVILVHVALSAVVICFFGFLTVVFGGVAETIVNLLTVWTAVITIFLLSLAGQLLCDASAGVADAAYHSMWYDSDLKVKRLVLFIIIRSQRPCYLSALGFSNMTLRSFSKIMSTAWTYFSLLVQIYEE